MPGFLATNMFCCVPLHNYRDENCTKDKWSSNRISVQRNTLSKFLDDKVFIEDEDIFIALEGVILNKSQICREGSAWNEALKTLYTAKGDTFFECFRGPFSGVLFDKKEQKLLAFTSHYADNAVFFFFDSKAAIFAVGSQVNYLLDLLKANHIALTLNEKSVYDMLTYGWMEYNNTYAEQIMRLLPGQYMKIRFDQNQMVELCTLDFYYRMGQNRIDLSGCSEGEIVKQLDQLFRDSIALEYDKDKEYGYAHLTDLSGGLDSRMNAWVANRMGYDRVTNLSYSMAGYLDMTTPQKIAADLGNVSLFMSLDDAGFMTEIDKLVSMNYGLSMYSFITGGQRLLDNINGDMYGIEHTGQLGDVIIGTFIHKPGEEKRVVRSGYHSTRYIAELEKYKIQDYANKEQYLIFVRGMLGVLSSHIIRRNYVEVASPFLNVELLEFCLSVPVEKRIAHKLYFHWIKQCYPEATKYVWEKTGMRPGTSESVTRMAKFIKRCAMFVVRRTFLRKLIQEKSMNPMHMWYREKPEIAKVWKAYYEQTIQSKAITNEKVRQDLATQYTQGTVNEKMQVLTVLGAIKHYFGT